MNTPGSSTSSSSHALWWRPSTWSDYFTRIVRHGTKTSAQQVPVHRTRRQELLLAQELRRKEQREHVLELLREVKEKNHPAAHSSKLRA